MAALGVEKLDKLMPDVVQTASKVDIASHVRDGYIMMFIYLPLTFGDKFTPYVGPIIPCILKVRQHDWILFNNFTSFLSCIFKFSKISKSLKSKLCDALFIFLIV